MNDKANAFDINQSDEAALAGPGGSGNVFLMKRSSTLDDAAIRNIVSQFANIHALRVSLPPDGQVSPLELSQKYRSVVRSAIIEQSDSEASKSKKSVKKQLEVVDLAWGLAEVVFFSRSNLVVIGLIEWVQEHSSVSLEHFSRVASGPVDADFWNMLFKLLLQGFFSQVVTLLGRVETFPALVEDMMTLLRQMPIVRAGNLSAVEFTTYRGMWRNSWRELKLLAETTGDLNLIDICLLCSGEREVLNKFLKMELFDEWYEGILAYIIYIEPSILRGDLPDLVQSLLANTNVTNGVDKLLHAILSQDNNEIAYNLCAAFPDFWAAVHLVDLFKLSGFHLSSSCEKGEERSDILEYLLLDYGSKLMSHEVLWPMAFQYLRQAGDRGMATMAALIENVPVHTDRQVLHLISACKREGLSSKVSDICHRRGVWYLSRGNYKNAIAWAVRGRDSPLAAQIGQIYLNQYSKTGHLPDTDILDTLGSHMFECTPLSLMCRYRKFLLALSDENNKKAAEILMDIAGENSKAPNDLKLLMLLDSIRLLESDSLSYESCVTLSDSFTLLKLSYSCSKDEELKTKLAIISAAISRSLIRGAIFC